MLTRCGLMNCYISSTAAHSPRHYSQLSRRKCTSSWCLGASHPKTSGRARHARAFGGRLSPRPLTTRMTPALFQIGNNWRCCFRVEKLFEKARPCQWYTPKSVHINFSVQAGGMARTLWERRLLLLEQIAACWCVAKGIASVLASILSLLSWADLTESSEDMLNVDRERRNLVAGVG